MHRIQYRRPELAQRREHAFTLGKIATVDRDDAYRRTPTWRRDNAGADREFVGNCLDELAVEAQHFLRTRQRVGDHSGEHRADGMELQLERGDYAEVATATADRPEEVRVFFGAGVKQP